MSKLVAKRCGVSFVRYEHIAYIYIYIDFAKSVIYRAQGSKFEKDFGSFFEEMP